MADLLASGIEGLIERAGELDFTQLTIVVQFLILERRKLQLELQEAREINEEWRNGVDRMGQELAQAKLELEKLRGAS